MLGRISKLFSYFPFRFRTKEMFKSDTANPQPEVPGESSSATISKDPVLKSKDDDNDGEGSEEKAKEDQKALL